MDYKIQLGLVVGLYNDIQKQRIHTIYLKKKFSKKHLKHKTLFNRMPFSKKFYKKWKDLDEIIEHLINIKHFIIENAALGNDKFEMVYISQDDFYSYTKVIEYYKLSKKSIYHDSYGRTLKKVRQFISKDSK